MAASGCAALTLSAATRASSASTVTWSALLPTLIPTTYCMVTVAASSDPSHRARDVFAQRVRLALDFLKALLDHVADANHAAQPPVALDHRDVPDTSVGHQRHDRAHLIVARAGEHLLGHHAVDARAQHLGAVIGERPHDPSLREDAGDPVPVRGDDQGADLLIAHAMQGVRDGRLGRDGANLSPFVRQDVLDVHRTIPPRCTRYGLVPVCCSSSRRASHTRWSMASSPPAMLSPSDADRRSAS